MRAWIAAAGIALVGSLLGWRVGHGLEKRKTTEVVEQMVQTMESASAAETARDIRVIELIGSGETQAAIRLLCTPLQSYYSIYGAEGDTNSQRSQLRLLIEQLVKSNDFVAVQLRNSVESGKPVVHSK